MSDGAADAVVIGAGVIGLTTAVRLLDAGLRVTIISADEPAETTSVLASAMIGPTFMPPGTDVHRWEQSTVREVATAGEDAGVHLTRGRIASRLPNMYPPGANALPGYALCAADELPVGFESGFWAEVPLVDMPVYMRWLARRVTTAGGELRRERLASLADAARVAPLVANCSGLGARELAADADLVPMRGPRIVVANPGVDTFFIEGPPGPAFTCYHPHGDKVVLGGRAVESASTTPDAVEAESIVAQCAAVEPRFAGATIIEHRVGLRPARPTVRLETGTTNGARVVHNYGHGGLGVTLAWGCADDAAALLTG